MIWLFGLISNCVLFFTLLNNKLANFLTMFISVVYFFIQMRLIEAIMMFIHSKNCAIHYS